MRFSFAGLAREAIVTSSSFGSRNELAEVIALAERGCLTGVTQPYPLENINEVFDRLQQGQIKGRAVLVP